MKTTTSSTALSGNGTTELAIKARVYRRISHAGLRAMRFADRHINRSNLGIDPVQVRQNPYPVYQTLRSRGTVLRSFANRGWMVLGYDEVEAVFKDARFGSDLRKSRFLSQALRAASNSSEVPILDNPSLVNLDPPDHTRLRKLVARGFLHKTIQSLEPAISTIVEECLNNIPQNEHRFDLVDQLAKPLPAVVIAELLGLPEADRAQFQRWSNDLLGLTLLDEPEKVALAAQANQSLRDYFASIIEYKRRHPGQDLIGQLIAAEETGDRLSKEEMYSTCVLLLTAGHETTTRLITNGMHALLQHPDQVALLRENPSLTPNAIEEMLRYEPPVQLMPRIATENLVLSGHKIKKNQLLLVLIASANRDPAANEDPERFDITRKSIRHIAFGQGIHLCLGLSLARLEARIAIDALLKRYPKLGLSDQKIVWTKNPFVRGMEHLYLTAVR